MSNYKRHAQGQRFRKKEFGDMGLRAYKEQQQTIINALKLQAQQQKTARDEYLSDSPALGARLSSDPLINLYDGVPALPLEATANKTLLTKPVTSAPATGLSVKLPLFLH